MAAVTVGVRTGRAVSARGARTVAWTGLLALFGVRLALLGGLLGNRPSPLGEFAYLLPLLLSASGALWVASRSGGVERRFWHWLAVATALLFASETYFSYFILYVDPVGPRTPAPFQLLTLGSALAFFAMIVTMSRFASAPLVTRLRFYSGLAAGLVMVFVVTFDSVIVPLLGRVPGMTRSAMAVAALYPVVGGTIFVTTLGVVLGWKLTGWRTWERLVAASLAVYSVGVVLMPAWFRDQAMASRSAPSLLDELVMALGPYLLFMAIVYRLTSEDPADALSIRPTLDGAPRWLVTFYPVALWVAVPVFGYVALSHPAGLEARLWLDSSLVLAFLLVLRSSLSWAELTYYRARASVDSLTGLGNEALLREHVATDVTEAGRYRGDVALVVVDIDDFSRVNDLYGHDAGDGVLRSVAGIMRTMCPEMGALYRAGGDEFALVAPGSTAEEARLVADRIIRSVESEVAAGGLVITASAGIAAFPSSESTDELVSHAFSALQQSKMTRRGSVSVYDENSDVLPSPDERLDIARKQSYLATVRALAAAVDARDAISRDHSRNVGRLARQLAEALGMEPDRMAALETAGLIHDIGKIALPDELLKKHRPLSEVERAHFREHVELGERILRSTDLAFMLPWVRSHHERWDGTGYPDRLEGQRIPVEARILAVCDAFDAMTTGLSGATPLSQMAALQEIDLGMGTQFDPRVAEAFIIAQSALANRQGDATH